MLKDQVPTPRVHIQLLGEFWVAIDDQRVETLSEHRRAADLVKLLALAPTHRMHREAVVEALWKHLEPEAARANLHKAASYARKSLGAKDAIVLRDGWVHLWPTGSVSTDADWFEREAVQALGSDDAGRCAAVGATHVAGLLPDDFYAEWTAEVRERLRRRYVELLRCAGQWEELVRQEPADEYAHREIIRELVSKGRRHAAIRQWQRLRDSLTEVGVQPGQESLALWRQLVDASPVVAPVAYSASPLVGRERELTQAREMLSRAGSGHGGTLLVTGDVGIGKTRFGESLLTEAAQLGWTTLRGSSSRVEGAAPWAPVAEAFDRVLRQRPEMAGALSKAAREGLTRLFGRELPSPSGTEVRGRQPILLAASQLLEAAAAEHGAVLWIDDMHLADEATLQLLHYLARAARYDRVLLVLGYQSGMLSATAAQIRASLLASQRAMEIGLGPVSPQDAASIVRTIAGSAPSEATLNAIYRLAEGNPFFTEEIAAAIGRAGSLALPERLREIVETRLGELEPELRAILQRVAVAGVHFTAEEFAAVADPHEAEPFDLLDAALRLDVLVETAAGYRFRHAVLRETLLASLPEHHRRAAHRCVAEALVDACAAPGRIAHHLVLSDARVDAVPWLERAALDAAAVGAVAHARRLAECALEFAPRRSLLLELRANCLFASGDRSCLTAYADAIKVARGRQRRRLRIRLARVAIMLSDLTMATRALDGLVATHPAERVDLLVAQGYAASSRGDLCEAERCAEEARRGALDEGLATELTAAATLRALVAHSQGNWQHQIELDLLDTSKVPQLAASVHDGHLCVIEHYLYGSHPYDELIDFAHRLQDAARCNGAGRGLAFATLLLGEAELLAGRTLAAEGHLREGAELHQRVGSPAGQSLSLQRLAEAALLAGRAAEARSLLPQALELARQSTLLGRHLLHRIYGTMVDAADGSAAALAVVEEAESAIGPTEACRMCSITFAVPAARACIRAGDLARAKSYLALAKDIAQPLWRGGAWHAAIAEAEAGLAAGLGNAKEAARLRKSACELFTASGQPHDARRCGELASLA